MTRGTEFSQFANTNPDRRGVRSRVTTGADKNGGGSFKEDLQTSVEIRLADLEKDAVAVAKIFNEPGVIEHLSGVAPAQTKRNIKRFREEIKEKMPDISVEVPVLIAVGEEIKEYYTKSANSELFVAVDAGKVVGTITLEKGGIGILWGQISRLAVSESARGKGIGTKLLQAANDRMFNELGYRGASAGIIRQVKGDTIPFHLFEVKGYVGASTSKDICLGWSIEEDKFVYRNSLRVTREIPREASPKAD